VEAGESSSSRMDVTDACAWSRPAQRATTVDHVNRRLGGGPGAIETRRSLAPKQTPLHLESIGREVGKSLGSRARTGVLAPHFFAGYFFLKVIFLCSRSRARLTGVVENSL
jgi:hypothetical protein